MLFKTLFIDHFKNHKIIFLSYTCLLLIIYPLESVILSNLFGKLFNLINKNRKLPNFMDIYNNLIKQNAPGLIFIISCIYVLLYFIYMTKNYFETILVPYYQKYLRTLLFNNVLKKYSNNYKDIKIGEVLSKIIELKYSIVTLFINCFDQFLTTFSGIICINIYFFTLNWKVGLMYFLSIVTIFITLYIKSPLLIDNSIKKMNSLYDNNEFINDKFSNLMNIYLNNEENKEKQNFNKIENILKNRYMKNIWLEKQSLSLTDMIVISSTIIIIIYSYYLLKESQINVATFISICITVSASMSYIYFLGKQITDSVYYIGIVLSNKDFLDEILNHPYKNIKNVNLTQGKIQFKNVYFKYENKSKYILKNFNYTIEPNTKIAFIGQSGSGKSTIMKLLIDLHPLTQGDILIDNVNIKNIDTEYLRNKIIYVNQKTLMFNKSVFDNIKYGTQINEQQIINLMEKYDLLTVFQKLPFGLKSNCGVNGNNLSMGMQKVIIMIRGILKNGIVYILDEPLTSLDSKTKKKIIKMIMNELKNKTIIVITHDKEIIPYMNKTININHLR
jgi:ABC-type multidrug transport system fused ATPase/permease subunit